MVSSLVFAVIEVNLLKLDVPFSTAIAVLDGMYTVVLHKLYCGGFIAHHIIAFRR